MSQAQTDVKLVTPANMQTNFELVDGQFRVKLDPSTSNKIRQTAAGLLVETGSATTGHGLEYFPFEMNTRAVTVDNNGSAANLKNYVCAPSSADGLGFISLEFAAKSATRIKIGTLVSYGPIPERRIVYNHVGGGVVWVEARSREIYATGLPVGQRVVVDAYRIFLNSAD